MQMSPVTMNPALHGPNGATGTLAQSVVVVVIALDLVTVKGRENVPTVTPSKKDGAHLRTAKFIASGLSGRPAAIRV